jgi:methylmalonyl-CoA/ethylmalonyl-CoA epimerase|tara:strand:+ start:1884 stop:2291 length:408 start_codon:yes stop_codon:yes gene_type:complete
MKILGIEHIGIAVKDLNESSSFWGNILNILHSHSEDVKSESVNTKIYNTSRGKIELLTSLESDSPIDSFIRNRGPGIHHVCLEVDDISQAITELKDSNIQVLNDVPKIGAEGFKVVFIHPKSTGGVLVELAEKPS